MEVYKNHQIKVSEDPNGKGWCFTVLANDGEHHGLNVGRFSIKSKEDALTQAKERIDEWLAVAPRTISDDAKIVIQKDGDEWCALMGENLQVGEAGFGRTPIAALTALLKPSNKRRDDGRSRTN